MDALSLRRRIEFEEFDYQVLLDSLRGYARPRDKISDLLRKSVIIRVKKGLYVFGDEYRRRPVSRELLANLIYGPSCLSLEYALHYYGLIPERVETLTSVTCGRSRAFATPMGRFTYRRIPIEAFRVGMDRQEVDDGRAFLIATREKALADKIVAERGAGIQTQKELEEFLVESLRVDPEGLRGLDPKRLSEIARAYRSRRVEMLSQLLAHRHRGGRED